MSAEEFGEWQAMFSKEQLHPAADRMRHAQLLAAIQNGALKKSGNTLWKASQFMETDPWAIQPEVVEAAEITPQQLAAQVASINARFES